MLRFCLPLVIAVAALAAERPNIVLVMTDDQGWGQTGYNNHPILKTPNLDAMAAAGLRFDRFYAAAPVCSPTRASVLTGRTPMRAGVPSHGYALRLQEKSLAVALRNAGYATGHFGKWHLNGLRGAGAPILADDSHSPGAFGFQEWLSVTNFFESDPLMGRHNGEIVAMTGDSSAVITTEALAFIGRQVKAEKPFFAVLWDGSPHSPWVASEADQVAFRDLDKKSRNHYGELVAFDRSIGQLRQGLRQLGAAENTLVWYCSDNGGLPGIEPGTVGKLRAHKGSMYEGGLRVPGIVEWPAMIRPRVSQYPACTTDIFPTIAELVGLPQEAMLAPHDGVSLKPLFAGEIGARRQALGFRNDGGGAWIDNRYKLVAGRKGYELYDLAEDESEKSDVASAKPELLQRLKGAYEAWAATVDASIVGKDYPEGVYVAQEPERGFWTDDPRYLKHKEQFSKVPQLESWAARIGNPKKRPAKSNKKKAERP